MLPLTTTVSQLPGIGDSYAQLLAKLNIHTVEDLIHHYPSRHEDYSQLTQSSSLIPGQKCTIQGQIVDFKSITTRNGKKLQFATLSDGQGEIPIVWFNQVYLSKVMVPGTNVSLSGKADTFNHKLSLIAPKFEIIRDFSNTPTSPATDTNNTVHTAGLIPIYPETAGISSKWLRAKIKYCLDRVGDIPDYLDDIRNNKTVEQYNNVATLPSLHAAIHNIHFPNSQQDIDTARHRLSFDELLFLQFQNLSRRTAWKQDQIAPHIDLNTADHQQFLSGLPFQLTKAQDRVIEEILKDLTQTKPMNRLVQGDVGSGKTVVAALAAYAAYKSGYQTSLMAPTEILATQHYNTLTKLLQPLGLKVVLHTGRTKHFKKKNTSDQELLPESVDVVVGTHALLYDPVQFENLGLVIIDEQHRFGVRQRATLIAKANTATNQITSPHVLSMTATPIPRTISLTLYGDLDVSLIDEMPPGRTPPQTHIVPTTKRPRAYEWITQQLKEPHKPQAFIVCPFIEPSETMETVKAATQEFEILQETFADFQLSLLHGRQSGDEKEAILQAFRDGKSHILVTTPVVEVGVDIPQATIMIIEGAERFGLAQLHQLRGRIGRGGGESYCFLFTSTPDAEKSRRLKALESTHSGFELAELDLKIRGPGQLYGTAQSGYVDLKIASYTDSQLIAQTRGLAWHLYQHIDQYPNLQKLIEKRTIQDIAPN